MPRPVFEVKVDGLQPFLRRLKRVEKRSKRRAILKSAMQAGVTIVGRALRAEIKSAGAMRKGHMRKAVATAVRVYNSGVVVMITGIKNKKTSDGENPGNYFHLVDLGVRPHSQNQRPVLVEELDEYRQVGNRPYRHPGFFGYVMKQPAEQKAWPKVQKAVMDKLDQRLTKELGRG